MLGMPPWKSSYPCIEELSSAMSWPLHEAVGPKEGTQVCDMELELAPGDEGDWRVTREAQIPSPSSRGAGNSFKQERGLCSKRILWEFPLWHSRNESNSIHEHAGWIPGLAQWIGDLVLP